MIDFSWRSAGKRRTPGARIVEIVRAEAGRSFSHIVSTEACWHRVRTLVSGERFVCCLYVPAGAVPFSLKLDGMTPDKVLVFLKENKAAARRKMGWN